MEKDWPVRSKVTVGMEMEKTTSLFSGKALIGGKTGERARLSMLMTEVMAEVFISRATPPLIFRASSNILEAIDL